MEHLQNSKEWLINGKAVTVFDVVNAVKSQGIKLSEDDIYDIGEACFRISDEMVGEEIHGIFVDHISSLLDDYYPDFDKQSKDDVLKEVKEIMRDTGASETDMINAVDGMYFAYQALRG